MTKRHSVVEDAVVDWLLLQRLQDRNRRAQQEPRVHDAVDQEATHCLQDSWNPLSAVLGRNIQLLKSMRPGIESLDGRARLPEIRSVQAELAGH